MLSKDNNTTYNKNYNRTNKSYSDIGLNKLYDINEDFDINDNNNGLTLNTLKKFKTFKEYKESLEKDASLSLLSTYQNKAEQKKDLHSDKYERNKISESSKKSSITKLDSLDNKYITSKKNILQDLKNTREKFINERHKSYQKLSIQSVGYPNIRKISRSTNISIPVSNETSNKQKKINIDENNSSNYIESLKMEALSLAQKMKKIDENASNDIIKRFEKITNNSLKKSTSLLNNDNKLEKSEIKQIDQKKNSSNNDIIGYDDKSDLKKNKNESNNYTTTKKTDADPSSTKNGKITKNEKEKVLNKNKEYNTGNNIDEKENKKTVKKTNNKLINEKNKDNEEQKKVKSKSRNKNKSENDVKSTNKAKKGFTESDMSKDNDMNEILNVLKQNSGSSTVYPKDKNMNEKSKQFKEKRKNEKKKVIEKLNEMKKVQEERFQIIEKESSEWEKTISDIEKNLASLKNSISSTDGLFTDLFKKGKELEIEIDSIKKKNMDFERSHYKHLDIDTTEEDDKANNTEKYEYFSETLYNENLTLPKADIEPTSIVQKKN